MQLLRKAGSVKVATILLSAIAVACVVGTLLPQQRANHYVYGSAWFLTLLAALGVNLIACTLSRRRIWRRRVGFVVSHVSILFIVAGALVDGIWGERGMMLLNIGDSANAFGPAEDRRSLPFAVRLDDFIVERGTPTMALTLVEKGSKTMPPPVTVSEGESYPLAETDHALRVEQISASVTSTRELTADSESGKLGVQFGVRGEGHALGGFLLEGTQEKSRIGTTMLAVSLRVFDDAAARDKDLSAVSKVEGNGFVEVALAGHPTTQVPVVPEHEQVLPDGSKITILQYLPHFVMAGRHDIRSGSDKPVNPAAQIEIAKEGVEPKRAWLFSKFPKFHEMHGSGEAATCRFVRPEALDSIDSVVLSAVRGGDIKYARVTPGQDIETGTVTTGRGIPLPGSQHTLDIGQVLPGARIDQVTKASDTGGGVPGLRVQLIKGDQPVGEPFWMTVGHQPHSLLDDSFAAAVSASPGRIADFKSRLQIIADGEKIVEKTIEVNHPLSYGGYSLYQSSYDRDHERWSGIEVVKGPGVPLIYLGFILFIGGLIIALYVQPMSRETNSTKNETEAGQSI